MFVLSKDPYHTFKHVIPVGLKFMNSILYRYVLLIPELFLINCDNFRTIRENIETYVSRLMAE